MVLNVSLRFAAELCTLGGQGMTTTVRKALGGDEKVLADLNAIVQEIHVANGPSHFKKTDPEEVTEWFRDLMQKPNVRIWIAEIRGEPVGYTSVVLHERPASPFCHARRWCEIDQIAVLPKHQRVGIARALAGQALEFALAEGVQDVELTTWSFNVHAHQAFQRMGFTPKVTRFGRHSGESGG